MERRPDGDFAWLHANGARRRRLLEDRARVLRAVRAHFDRRGYLEVETPLAVPSPGLDLHLDAMRVEGEPARWLITSPEYQMKRLLAGGLERIYQICKCFRRGELGIQHEPEFSMLEWYRAHCDVEAMMSDTEALVGDVAREVLAGATKVRVRGHEVDLGAPWERLSVRDAFLRHAGVDVDTLAEDDDRFYLLLVDQVEPRLGIGRPTLLHSYPARMASLARLSPTDATVAERFEAYVGGVELCNGFGELTDPREQRARLERDQRARAELGKEIYPIDERFLASLEEGLPPASGNALGLDRLVMILLGAAAIEDVIAFSSRRL